MTAPSSDRIVLSPAEFAEAFDVDPGYVRRLCQAGRLATIPKRPGSRERWRIHVTEVDRVLREGLPADPHHR